MALQKTTNIYGFCLEHTGNLRLTEHRHALVEHDALYEMNGRVIAHSAVFRGSDGYRMMTPSATTTLNPHRMQVFEGEYFWLGMLTPHFGHFLIGSLARLWALGNFSSTLPIACRGADPKALFKDGFARDILNLLQIDPERFIAIPDGSLLERVHVAEPALTENHSISPVYTDYLRRAFGPSHEADTDYIYVSKQNLSSGVLQIENEEALCAYLGKWGVRCISPLNLSFSEQISLWKNNNRFVGFSGSAFNFGSLFGNREYVIINRTQEASGNQLLLDHCGKNRALHVYCDTLMLKGPSAHFNLTAEIPDVEQFGNALLTCMERFRTGNITPTTLPDYRRSAARHILRDEPLGEALSRHGQAAQSSTYNVEEGRRRDAGGALSGTLTGSYQCHTELEENPWWKIDLTAPFELTEIRLYNRIDIPGTALRSTSFAIQISNDDMIYTTVDEQHLGEAPFGGMDGHPYRWIAPGGILARYVRVMLLSVTHLHLDQVEVFGRAPEALC